jgi:tRNA threonylcarbamoyl adenosine modification protein YeaZ
MLENSFRRTARHSELWLALDTASAVGSFSLHRRQGETWDRVADEEIGPQQVQSERLITQLSHHLNRHGVKFGDIDRFVATIGPGSFTGLRIALATLKAFAYSEKKPIETLSGSEARALAWKRSHPGGQPIVVLTRVALTRYVVWTESAEVVTDKLDPAPGSLVLADEASASLRFPDVEMVTFPLRASYLNENLLEAKSRRTHQTLAEWITLSPEYLGATRFKMDLPPTTIEPHP